MTFNEYLDAKLDQLDTESYAITYEVEKILGELPSMDCTTEGYFNAVASAERLSTLRSRLNYEMQTVIEARQRCEQLRETNSEFSGLMDRIENFSITNATADNSNAVNINQVTPSESTDVAKVEEPEVFTEENPVIAEKKYTAEDAPKVRTALANKKKSGVDIVAVMKKFGATNFKDVNPNDYDALMAELGE